MPRYVAFLRGVSPMNCQMPVLKRCLEQTGFTDVRTVLSSGNVAFDTTSRSEAAITRKAEAAIEQAFGRRFTTFVRSARHLQALIASDPYAAFGLVPEAKRVVTFLREPVTTRGALPPETDGVRILVVGGLEAYSAYVPRPGNPVFMALIEKTFGKDATTRTLDTVKRCALA